MEAEPQDVTELAEDARTLMIHDANLVVLDGLVTVEYFLGGEFGKALDGVRPVFDAQVQFRRLIEQSRNRLDVAVLTCSSAELHGDHRAASKRRLERHQLTDDRLVTTHLRRHL